MRVGVNLLFLKPGIAGGTETYSMGLLRAMKMLNTPHTEYVIFCDTNTNLQFLANDKRFTIVRFNKMATSLSYRLFFEQVIFPFKLKKYKLNVLHSFGYSGPFYIKNHVVTIHDTNSFASEHNMGFAKKNILSFFLKQVAKHCTHIITVSFFSKQEIIKHLKVAENKVTVVYEACKNDPLNHNEATLPGQFSFLQNSSYFMALGSFSVHKNIHRLVAAFNRLKKTHPDVKLVLSGHLPVSFANLLANDAGQTDSNVIVTGYIDDSTLQTLIHNALCFVFPSLYEGFGLPLIEAQAEGVPVIASDRGSLPEIGGDSVMYFSAEDDEDLAAKMEEMYTSQLARDKYIAIGLQNVKKFSWLKAAKENIKIYHFVTNGTLAIHSHE